MAQKYRQKKPGSERLGKLSQPPSVSQAWAPSAAASSRGYGSLQPQEEREQHKSDSLMLQHTGSDQKLLLNMEEKRYMLTHKT